MSSGRRIGPYEIVSPLGAGGMGEVYRARDTRLGREVAVKALADGFAEDADRVARFHREAQLLAALNHPHIATIHGLEQADGSQFLVMELVEGGTLADRLKDGPVPVAEALKIARQVADALQAAHEKGIVHRDLKPANIAFTAAGHVKVLDFGLAKALDPVRGSPDATHSPTLTLAATQAGVILGTAAYMAPEQARGKVADKRCDIWAFGCVLYEMLAGTRAFDGEDVAVILAAVIKGEPDWTVVPSEVPAAVRVLLRTCLEKDRRARIADIAAATFVLDHAPQLVERTVERVDAPSPSLGVTEPWRRASRTPAVLLLGALLSGAGVWWLTRPAVPPAVRATIATSGETELALQGNERDVAVTPDGLRIVYRGSNRLLVRSLNQLEPVVLDGLGQPQGPFVSPDGEWVGFFDAFAQLKKVAINGGPPVTIASIDGGGTRGATWGSDGTIVFATNSLATGLQRVSAAGGEAAVLTKPDRERGEDDHAWPEFLPDGQSVLFTILPIGGGLDGAQVAVLDLRTATSKVLIRGGSDARYLPSGHLVYGVAGTLRAVAFDLKRLEVVGTPAPVLEGVTTTTSGAADIAVAANGSLVYVAGVAGGGGQQTVVSVDRQGRASALPGLPLDSYRDVRVSPDGARLALATATDVWTYDLARATLSRLTTDPANDTRMLWTADAQRILFTSNRAGYAEIFWRPADGTGSDERFLTRGKEFTDLRGSGWSADGRHLLFTEVTQRIQCAIGHAPIERPSEASVLVKSEFCNDWPAVSPDGRWMAYHSNVSGRIEIYVERYPDLGNRQQISTTGGRIPAWSRDGREMFFSSLDNRQMLAVAVKTGATLVAGRPQVLFESSMASQNGSRPFDVAPDGRFFIIRSGQTEAGVAAPNLILVQHWIEELKRLVPIE